MSRVETLHADACAVADPEKASTWTKIGHKIEKTAWSTWDHKLPSGGTIALGVAGVLVSVAAGVLTGGASLAVQFAVVVAIGIGQGGLQKALDHSEYQERKEEIEERRKKESGTGGTRQTARMIHENLAYNDDHYLSTLAALIEATKDMKAYDSTKMLNGEKEMQEFVAKMAVFWDRYQRSLHYFVQFEEFVDYSHRFAAAMKKAHDERLPAIESAMEHTVKQSRDWHKANCRTSRFSKDVCYGLRDGVPEVAMAVIGDPHHRLS